MRSAEVAVGCWPMDRAPNARARLLPGTWMLALIFAFGPLPFVDFTTMHDRDRTARIFAKTAAMVCL